MPIAACQPSRQGHPVREGAATVAYVIPNFNLLCNIWRNTTLGNIPSAAPTGPPDMANVPCALVFGRRVNVASTGGTNEAGVPLLCMSLLTRKGTNIQGPEGPGGVDSVECPAGTGRYYWVAMVDDIGKGYPNEHRTAGIFAIANSWTPPYP